MAVIKVQTSLMAACSVLSSGMNMGYSAIALPLLSLEGEDRTWFASIASVATPIGCLLAGPTLDAIGRRWTITLVNVPFILGWLVLVLTPDSAPIWQLYLGRLLTGLGSGCASLPSTVYIAEMATSRMRPMLVTWPSISISLGILLVYLFGYLMQDWRLVAGVNLIFPVATAIMVFFFLHESPVWLVAKNRDAEAEKSLMWSRNVTEITPELKTELKAMQDHSSQQQSSNLKEKLALFKLPECWKPLLILNLYFFFMQLSGVYVVIFYAVDIVTDAGVSIDSFLAAVFLGIFQLVAGFVASYALNRCGRRPMSLLSGIIMSICMIGLGAYQQVKVDNSLSWVPLTLIIIFIGATAAGFNTIPWAMLGELFPPKVKGISGGITTCLSYSFSFAATKLYPGGDAEIFYLYGAASTVATVYLLLFLPETFGKTLQEIGDHFKQSGSCITIPCHKKRRQISLIT